MCFTHASSISFLEQILASMIYAVICHVIDKWTGFCLIIFAYTGIVSLAWSRAFLHTDAVSFLVIL